jgi:hypothetical protein
MTAMADATPDKQVLLAADLSSVCTPFRFDSEPIAGSPPSSVAMNMQRTEALDSGVGGGSVVIHDDDTWTLLTPTSRVLDHLSIDTIADHQDSKSGI